MGPREHLSDLFKKLLLSDLLPRRVVKREKSCIRSVRPLPCPRNRLRILGNANAPWVRLTAAAPLVPWPNPASHHNPVVIGHNPTAIIR